MAPTPQHPNILRAQKEGTQIFMPKWGQSLTLAQNVRLGLLLRATLPTGGAITEPHYMYMSSQGVMSGEQTNNSPGRRHGNLNEASNAFFLHANI